VRYTESVYACPARLRTLPAVTARFVVVAGLDPDQRREFIESVSGAIGRGLGSIELDCSQVALLDGPTLGMLVTAARVAQFRGQRVVLVGTSKRVRRALDDAGVGYLFAWTV
jgi:anti-anti-sigma regulatory factor